MNNQTYKITDTGNRMAKHREYTFEGVPILQHPDITKYFPKIINDFDRIIELGTYTGGLTLYLHRIKRPETELISYDIDTNLSRLPEGHGLDTRWGSWWDENWIKEFKELMSEKDKRTLILCDGGYKEDEFKMFSPYLKVNDVIMVHDYAERYIEEWNSYTHPIEWYDQPDSSYSMIEESIKKNGLEKHELYNEFKSVLWGIFIKTK
jgi:cephalosporin hydroxylase